MDSQNEALKGRVMDKILKADLVGKEPSWKVRQMARLVSVRNMLAGNSQKNGRLSKSFARFTSKFLDPGVVHEGEARDTE